MIDHYQVLGVRRDATRLAIKRAYRKLAKRYHPDRNPEDAGAEERFKEINAAYEVLGDAEERWQYDRKLFGLDRGPQADGVVSETGREASRGRWPKSTGPATVAVFKLADGALGGLLAFCFALAAAERSAAPGIAAITLVALALGWFLAGGRDANSPAIGARSRLSRPASLLAWTALGVVVCGLVAPAAPRALLASSGWFFALAGGLASGLLGAGFGRFFRSAAGWVAGVISAVVVGTALGGGLAGFLWYWSAVFRWTRAPWPPDESQSLVALAGVIGSAVGGGLAALVGAMRSPADRE